MKNYCLVLLSFLLMVVLTMCQKASENPFEGEIQDFEQSDIQNPPGNGMILFVGSSSIRMWKNLEKDFPDMNVLNRGFGGSETSDAIYFFDRVVAVYKPAKIIFYEGDNDIANGKSSEQVVNDFKTFLGLVDEKLPGTPVGFIAIKPSPSRWDLHEEMEKANDQIRKLSVSRPDLEFIDVYTPMLGPGGRPVPDIFLSDSLHMNEEGYKIWKSAVSPFLFN